MSDYLKPIDEVIADVFLRTLPDSIITDVDRVLSDVDRLPLLIVYQ